MLTQNLKVRCSEIVFYFKRGVRNDSSKLASSDSRVQHGHNTSKMATGQKAKVEVEMIVSIYFWNPTSSFYSAIMIVQNKVHRGDKGR